MKKEILKSIFILMILNVLVLNSQTSTQNEYKYDKLNRLVYIKTTTNGNISETTYTYDDLGNRTGSTIKGVPVLTTTNVTNITTTTASSGGNITNDGGAAGGVTSRGVCWSTSPNPTTANSKTSNGSDTGSFTSNMTGLSSNTSYYVRAYAVNQYGTGYGEQKSFTTNGINVIIKSDHYYQDMICINEEILFTPSFDKAGPFTYTWKIDGENSGSGTTLKDTFTAAGEYVITLNVEGQNNETGIGTLTITITDECPVTVIANDFETCKNSSPTIYPYIFGGSGTYSYSWTPASDFVNSSVINATISNAEDSKELKLVATDVATNAQGYYDIYMAVGPSISFNKTNIYVTGDDPVDLTDPDVLIITISGGSSPYQPKWMNNGSEIDPTSIYPPFSSLKYIFVVTDANGCTNEEGIYISTSTVPTLTTTVISNISENSASGGGNITDDGGASITARGVCWSTSHNPTTADSKTTNGSGTGSFTSSITGLSSHTTYYLRAYAVNSYGTAYGEEKSFITADYDIVLSQGWNMISSNYLPDSPDGMESIFSSILDKVIIAKNNSGAAFIPKYEINNIGSWNVSQGYQVYMTESASLPIYGTEVNPANAQITLYQGWNIISYLRNSELDCEAAFANLSEGNLIIVKDNYGNVYIPTYGINTIGNLLPGQGYQIYVLNAGVLVYPGN